MSECRKPVLSRRCLLGVLALGGVLSGCASVAPSSALAPLAVRHGVAQQLTPAATAAEVQLGIPSRAWWEDLGDGRLNTLVRLAMARNPALQAMLASVQEARALAGLAEREALPQGSLSLQAQRLQASQAEVNPFLQDLPRPPARTLTSVGQTVSWELDLFGRAGTASKVAQRQWDAARADAHAATALLQAEVVRQYVRLRRSQQETQQLAAEHAVLDQRHTLMQARVDAGLADRREAWVLEAELARLQAEQAHTLALQHAARAALAVLAGRAPTQTDAAWESLMAAAEVPMVPASARLIQPSDLLAHRPDVAKADAQLRASLGNTVLAERAHLPRLSLNMSVGALARPGDLGSLEALRYGAGPLLQWDWLNMGRAKARAAAAQAGSERALHHLEQTVLKALEDSEGALRAWVAARQAWQQSRQAEQAARAVADYAAVRARSGLEPSVQAMEPQLAYLRARRQTLAAQAGTVEAFAQVQLALGAWPPAGDKTPP